MIRKILFILRYPNLEFDSEIWKSDKNKRSCFINKILRKKEEIGFEQEQLLEKYGKAWRIYSSGTWSYEVPRFFGKKHVLNFYFDENDRVKDIKLKYRIRL